MTAVDVAPDYEGSRARLPDESGFVERDGVRTWWEAYGHGEPTILFMPTWSIVHSRIWRNQIPYFARHFRVVVFDGRGNGRSDRPSDPAAYEPQEFVADALAVMDATGTERAIVVGLSMSTIWTIVLAAGVPDRVVAAAFVGPTPYAVAPPFPDWAMVPFEQRFDGYDGFEGQNRWFILEHYEDFVDYWIRLSTPEPHSSRAIEFGRGMALETTPDVVLATLEARAGAEPAATSADALAMGGGLLRPLAQQIRCPVVVINGELDPIALPHWAAALAEDTGGELVTIPNAGHAPGGRKPVAFNLALRRFVERVTEA